MMRKPLIAGNWKLNKTINESQQLSRQLLESLGTVSNREIVIAPVFTALNAVSEIIKSSSILLAAQNCYPATTGAFTGELSPLFLQDAGCQYVIIGHSERRQLLHETNAFINQKLIGVIQAGLKPILCIGETLQQREDGQMLEILGQQIKEGLVDLTTDQMATVVIAYEPIWAIGTGKTASSEQAQEAHAYIRSLLQEIFNSSVAEQTRILYGGSVKPDNIDTLMAQTDIDGALVGGASLKAEDFVRIVRFL
ncbi:triosephosphate isomerase [Desulfuromusa kysingii]|uniref:Triosephosphate isomerase n=2 Tax=Desulfuromusa kysingii TaxID=37625 RepID=A0A1H4BCB6_9BACT|nr:triose-phosphate isomerase [Desulfuromusa kysingii]SEA45628.1 triosephosphate isomerase [Desulfuromusa kysingii]